MGKIADALRDVAMPDQKRRQVLSLDKQFSDLEAENKALKMENTKLQAQVNPLQREVDTLKQRIKAQDGVSLDELSESILAEIAKRGHLETGLILEQFRISTGKCEHHLNILRSRNFIETGRSFGLMKDYVLTTSDGLEYLANKNLL